jgi:hypothetical protein
MKSAKGLALWFIIMSGAPWLRQFELSQILPSSFLYFYDRVESILQMLAISHHLLSKRPVFFDPFSKQLYLPQKFFFGLRDIVNVPLRRDFVEPTN